jgi:hypothetical protein
MDIDGQGEEMAENEELKQIRSIGIFGMVS